MDGYQLAMIPVIALTTNGAVWGGMELKNTLERKPIRPWKVVFESTLVLTNLSIMHQAVESLVDKSL